MTASLQILISKSEFLNKFQIINTNYQSLEFRASSLEFKPTTGGAP